MKQFILVLLVVFSAIAFAQTPITLTGADMPLVNTTQHRAMDTLPLPTVNVGNPGTNKTYDFSNLLVYKYDTVKYRPLTNNQQSNFPNADVAITTDGISFIFTKTNINPANFSLQGFQGPFGGANVTAQLSPVNVIYSFPYTYGNTATGSWGFQEKIPGGDLNLPAIVNDVRITFTATNTDTIDGWGKTVTPLGAYPSLRNKRVEYSRTLIEYSTIFTPNSYETQSDTRDTTIRYSYLAKESKGALVTLEYDSLDNLKDVIYSMTPPPAPTVSFTDTNTAGGLVNFASTVGGYNDSYSWNFGDGSSTSTQPNPSHTYTANGAYTVCLTVTNGTVSTTYCNTVIVTNIPTTGNNKPIAVDDVYTVLQASSQILHVAGNDVDTDGDNICVTEVWGSTYATEYIGGTCDMILFEPDSTFTGNDTAYYTLCDDGAPVLCDTGMVVFTVTQDTALLPVPSFTSYQSGNCGQATYINTSQGATGSASWLFTSLVSQYTDTASGDTVVYLNPVPLSDVVEATITVSNQFGSVQLKDTLILVCSSINDISLSNISLYPNPTNSYINIDMSNNDDEITRSYAAIEIYNALGQKHKTFARNGTTAVVNLNVTELPQGMYVATILSNNGGRMLLGRFTKE